MAPNPLSLTTLRGGGLPLNGCANRQGETRGYFVGSQPGDEVWEMAILETESYEIRLGCGWRKARTALEPPGQERINNTLANRGDNVKRSGKVV